MSRAVAVFYPSEGYPCRSKNGNSADATLGAVFDQKSMAPRASWKAYTPWLIDQLKIFANDKTKSIMQSPEEILKLLIAEKELDKQVYTMEKFKPVISKIIKDLSLDKADSKK